MKVLLINGSPHQSGCTYTALSEVSRVLNDEGIRTEILQIGPKPVQGCIACGRCAGKGRCAFSDIVNSAIERMEQSDVLIVGSPVYYAAPNGSLIPMLNRMFYAGSASFAHKPGAAVASASFFRRSRLKAFTMQNTTRAMMRKLMTAFRKLP